MHHVFALEQVKTAIKRYASTDLKGGLAVMYLLQGVPLSSSHVKQFGQTIKLRPSIHPCS